MAKTYTRFGASDGTAMANPDRLVNLLRSSAARWIGFAAGVAGFAYLVSHFLRMEPSEVAILRAQSPGSLALGLVGYCLFNLLTLFMLRRIIGGPSGSIWATSQLVKYLPVPGSAMLGMVSRAVQLGYHSRRALGFMTRHSVLLLAGGIAVGSASIGASVQRAIGSFGTTISVALLTIGLALGYFVTGRESGPGARAAMCGLAASSWMLLGLVVWAGVGMPLGSWTLVTSSLAAAWVVGLLALPVPAGIGVREAALILFLSTEVGRENAIAFALITRVLHIASDGIIATGLITIDRYRGARAPVAEPPR